MGRRSRSHGLEQRGPSGRPAAQRLLRPATAAAAQGRGLRALQQRRRQQQRPPGEGNAVGDVREAVAAVRVLLLC